MPDPEAIAGTLRRLQPRLPDEPLDQLADQIETLAGPQVRGRRELALRAEVDELVRVIETMRREISETPLAEISNEYLVSAADQLEAILAHTTSATDTILSACEALSALPGVGPLPAVREMTARIYEACTFQDITCQRIGKAIASLKAVETKVGAIREAFAYEPVVELGDQALLSGPPLPADAIGQPAIDALLGED